MLLQLFYYKFYPKKIFYVNDQDILKFKVADKIFLVKLKGQKTAQVSLCFITLSPVFLDHI